jgi:HAD superfamily hydrolase (TIGR01509 family)
MKIRWPAVAFDLDGLLLDSEPVFLEAARRLLAKRGVELDPVFMHRIMGMPGRDSLPLFQVHFGLTDSVEAIGDDYRHYFMEACNGGLIELKPGAQALIDRLHTAAVPLAIATSSRKKYVDNVFGPHGLLDRFRHIFTADDVTNGKPAPDVYVLAAQRFEIEPHELLVFEDSPNGVQAAKAAGCICVAVPQAHVPREKVAIADFIAESLTATELTSWLHAKAI